MSSGGTPNYQVVSQQIDPAMKPYIAYGLSEAERLYQKTGTPSFYPKDTYISPSASTQQALQYQANRAVSGNPLLPQSQQTVGELQVMQNPALAAYQNLYSNAQTDPSRSFYQNLSSGNFADTTAQQRANLAYLSSLQGDPSSGFYQQLATGAAENAAMPLAEQTAAGAYLGGNPFFSGAFAPAAQAAEQAYSDAMQRVASQASQAGRYGSNAMGQLQDRATGQFAQSLANTAGQLAYQNYAAERGLQESGIGRLAGMSQQDIANQIIGAQGLTSGQQANIANQLSAAGFGANLSQQQLANQIAGAQALTAGGQQTYANQMAAAQALGGTAAADYARQLQAASMGPSMAAADYQDIQSLYDVGQIQESYQQAALADAMARYNFAQTLPQQKLTQFLSAAYGAPMGSQTSQPIYRNPGASTLGGALAGQALGGTSGAIAGGLAGLLGYL